MTALVAWGGKQINERMISVIAAAHDDTLDEPAGALVEASETADIIVVGSRGLHGLKALGSVSERVAHRAKCSALVVREPVWQRVAEEVSGSYWSELERTAPQKAASEARHPTKRRGGWPGG